MSAFSPKIAEKPSPFVRRYRAATDFDAVIHVFRETCDDTLKVEPIWTIGSYIWCRPYLFLEPNTSFVLDDGSGSAVGYILGAADSQDFCQRWEREYIQSVKDELEALPGVNAADGRSEASRARRKQSLLDLIYHNPRKLLYGGFESELEVYAGHLHIDILPLYQRHGYGKQLVQTLLQALKTNECNGVFIGVIASNIDALKFYEATGFKRLPRILDGGASGEMGRTSPGADGGEEIYFVTEI